jgi:hypothetical protein
MDQTTALLGTGTAGTIVGILVLVYKAINHKRLRSSCCGKTAEVSFDVGQITPPKTAVESAEKKPVVEV